MTDPGDRRTPVTAGLGPSGSAVGITRLDPSESTAHRGDHLLPTGPRPADELGDQASLAGDHRAAVDLDVELATPAGLQLDIDATGVSDLGGETRRLGSRGASGLAVDDLHIRGVRHSASYAQVLGIRPLRRGPCAFYVYLERAIRRGYKRG